MPNPEGLGQRHQEMVQQPVDLEGNAQGTPLVIGGAAAQTAALLEGVYDLWSDVDCWIKVATTANDVTAVTGYLLRALISIPLIVRANRKIGAITEGGAGTLSYHKVG